MVVQTENGSKHVVEVLEDDLATFRRDDSPNILMRQRGRLAQKLVRQYGFANYHCLSYVELEYAVDDLQIIDSLVNSIVSPDASSENISHKQLHDKSKKVDVLN